VMNPRNPRTDRRPKVAGEPRELEALYRLHIAGLRAEGAGTGKHLRRGQMCAPGLTFCLPVGRIVIDPLDNPPLSNGKMHM
jgi:hypothetical protein